MQRPRRAVPIRELHDTENINLSGTILPPVDNLWNNSIVGANVSVKSENVVSYIDDVANKVLNSTGEASLYESIEGRLPVKQLEPLSDESDDDDNQFKGSLAEEMHCSSQYSQQNNIAR